ncbi:2-hydroxyacid dehydrogenase [Pseudaestuariivita sp.]|uniref:2-hydroxyacid dehydrogenase n=1 Tax=Pseudaestuariivita sp. TaxID=2211669 RepID=UPI0040593A08
MITIQFAARTARWAEYEAPLRAALEARDLQYRMANYTDEAQLPPAEVDYIVYAPNSHLQDFTPYTRCKAVLNIWAGVEEVVHNPSLTQPLTRMVDHGLTQGMVEWVVGHTMRHHLGMDADITRQDSTWDRHVPPLAEERPVTILGLGALGTACGQALTRLGFPVRGWSRSPKSVEGIETFSGDAGLARALEGAQVVILLLPATPATENVLNAETLRLTAPGAFVLNPGRGPLIDDDALLAALDAGQIGHATLDVFREEPLPSEHPFWAHPKVTVTPHIASETRASTASTVIAENIARGEAGQPFLHLVDREAGY